MRYTQIIEASMPFGKIGNTTGMTFGFESEVVGKAEAFADEDVNFDDEDDLIRELNIDRDDFDTGYNEWLEDGNEGDWEDWIAAVGITQWWNDMHVSSYEYTVVDDRIVRLQSWGYAIEYFAEGMKDELNIKRIVTSYDPETPIDNKNYSDWHIEGDGSVHGEDENDHPFEVISPVYHSYEDFVKGMTEYFNYITGHWGDGIYTNRTTGFHVNIGMPNAKERIDPLKLLLFSGEKWVAQLWRQDGNGYTDELIPKLDAQGLPRSIKDASAFMQQFISGLNEKSFAINFLTLIERGYVEFRPIGNADYQHRLKDILNHISRFIQLIQIASDPSMYAQEYAKKLGTLIGGGKADTSNNSLPFDKRLVRQWIDGTNLRDSDKRGIMDAQGNIHITASMLVRLVGFMEIPTQVLKIIIKNAHITREDYIAALQHISSRGWIMDEAGITAARAILDPYFGVSGPLPE